MKIAGYELNEYAIITADDESSLVAGRELQDYLKKYCEYNIPNESEERSCCILVGISASGDIRLPLSSLKNDDSFIIKTYAEKLFICGKTSEGTLYGVYHFLNLIGIDWLTPDQEYADVDRNLNFTADISYNFSSQIRMAYGAEMRDERFRARQRLKYTVGETNNKPAFGNIRGIEFAFGWGYFGHTFEIFIPYEEYYTTHPEYFSFAKGIAPENHQYQICLTNPQVLKIVTDKSLSYLETHPSCKILSVSVNDSYGEFADNVCMCPECAKLYHKYGDNYSGVLLEFVNKVADAVGERFPRVLIHTFGYKQTVNPPVGIKPRKNVMVQVCLSHNINKSILSDDPSGIRCKRQFDRWKSVTENLHVWTYLCNFPFYFAPSANLKSLYEDTTYMLKQGVYGIFQQDCYDDFPFEFSYLRTYLVAKMFNFPNMSYGEYLAYIDRFLGGYYGNNSGKYLKKYLFALEELFSESHAETALEGDFNEFAEFDNKDYIDKCKRLFRKALSVADDDIKRKRIENSKKSFDFSELIYLYRNIGGDKRRKNAYAKKKEKLFRYAYEYKKLLIYGESTSRRLENIDRIDWTTPPFTLCNIMKKIVLTGEEKSAVCYSDENTDERIKDFSFEFIVKKQENKLIFDIFVHDADCTHTNKNILDWCQDSIEVFFSETLHGTKQIKNGDFRIRINADGDLSAIGNEERVSCSVERGEGGYRILLTVLFDGVKLERGKRLGFEIIAHNVGDNGYLNTVYWNSPKNSIINNFPQLCGEIKLI